MYARNDACRVQEVMSMRLCHTPHARLHAKAHVRSMSCANSKLTYTRRHAATVGKVMGRAVRVSYVYRDIMHKLTHMPARAGIEPSFKSSLNGCYRKGTCRRTTSYNCPRASCTSTKMSTSAPRSTSPSRPSGMRLTCVPRASV